MLIVYILVAVVLITLAIAIYSGSGGRAWLGTREKPLVIIGRSVQLTDCYGFGESSVTPPSGILTDHDAQNYRLEFSRPFILDGREEEFAWIRARHIGYPLSGAARRATFAYGSLQSGRRFIARLTFTDADIGSAARQPPNQAMQLTASKPDVYAVSVCHLRFLLRRDRLGLAAADLGSR